MFTSFISYSFSVIFSSSLYFFLSLEISYSYFCLGSKSADCLQAILVHISFPCLQGFQVFNILTRNKRLISLANNNKLEYVWSNHWYITEAAVVPAQSLQTLHIFCFFFFRIGGIVFNNLPPIRKIISEPPMQKKCVNTLWKCDRSVIHGITLLITLHLRDFLEFMLEKCDSCRKTCDTEVWFHRQWWKEITLSCKCHWNSPWN